MVSFTLTNDSITVVYNGKSYTVQKSTPQFTGLRKALIEENWTEVPKHLTIAKSLNAWAKGRFTLNEATEVFSYDGREVPVSINNRIISMATRGEDPTPVFNFFERLNRNPSMRSVEQLYPFLQHAGISITPDGHFLAYKGVNSDYKDCHTNSIDNRPGQVVTVPRNQVSDDPRQACHFGLHAGSKSYASGYGARLTVVKIDPEHVVCVPYDSSEKLRCSEYEVIGNASENLSSTVHDEQELPPDEPDLPEGELFEEDEFEDDSKLFDSSKGEFVEEEKPLKRTSGGVSIPSKYSKLAAKPVDELMKLPLDRLRELATYGLKIIGASKIPGGKSALVAKIEEVRGSR